MSMSVQRVHFQLLMLEDECIKLSEENNDKSSDYTNCYRASASPKTHNKSNERDYKVEASPQIMKEKV